MYMSTEGMRKEEGYAMRRFAVCLAFLVFFGLPVWAAENELESNGFTLPGEGSEADTDDDWLENIPRGPRVEASLGGDTATTLDTLIAALAQAEVSGAELADEVESFRQQWKEHCDERKRLAESLAELAAAFEGRREFAKALALYERIWEDFPERQDLIGKVKREHALGQVEIDLSTPEKAFESLQRSLLVYKLTADTFGIREASAILYEPGEIELHELLEWRQQLEADLAALDEESERKPIEEWPEPVQDPWSEVSHYLWSAAEGRLDLNLNEAAVLDVLQLLRKETGFPIVMTPAARAHLAELTIDMRFERMPPWPLLRTIVEHTGGAVGMADRPFHLLLYSRSLDESQQFITQVVQHEPWAIFPDDAEPAPQEEQGRSQAVVARFFLGMERVPDGWFVHIDPGLGLRVVTVPRQVAPHFDVTSTWDIGKYQGRVYPLLRCLRGYPLPGQPVWDGRNDGKDRYTYLVQVGWQVRRMQHFLGNRLGTAMLLQTRLLGVEEHQGNRYKPKLGLEAAIDLGSQLGLWYDGRYFRFLIFDSSEDRDRWLHGEDWVDMPSDLNDYDRLMEESAKRWPPLTEEEMNELVNDLLEQDQDSKSDD